MGTPETKKGIHSLLLSSKEGLSTLQLERDYKEFMFSIVPYKKLGYASCAQMLDNMPDVCRRAYDKTGAVIYKAISTDKTAHLEVMIAHQKPKKKKTKGNKFSSSSRKPKSNYSFQATHKYNPSSYSKYYTKRSYNTGPAYTPHMNFPKNNPQHPVHNASRWPSGQLQEPRAPSRTFQNQVTSSPAPVRYKQNPSQEQTESVVRENMDKLLSFYPLGVWLHMLPSMYLGYLGVEFPVKYKDTILTWTDLIDHQTLHNKDILYKATEESRRAAAARNLPDRRSPLLPPTSAASNHLPQFPGEIPSAALFHSGEKCKVYVSHVVAERCRIYVHRATSSVDFLMNELTQYYDSLMLKTFDRVSLNCVCAAKDSRFNAWSRATVTRAESPTKIDLFYVDFGNTEMKQLNELQPLPQHLSTLPAQASPVTLDGITTNNFTLLSKEFLSLTQHIPLHLKCVAVEGGVASVILVDYREPDITINDKLVSLGLARREDGISSTRPPHSSSTPYSKAPISSISPVLAPSPDHINVSSYSTWSSIEPSEASLPESAYWIVIVTHILTPSAIFVRIQDNHSEDFNEFIEKAEQVYHNDKCVSMLDIGELYAACAVFPDDGPTYCRVKASSLLDAKTVDCEFVDYGFHHEVDRNRIYSITAKHAQIPLQARKCALYGMDQVSGDNEAVINKLEEMTDDKTLIAQLITIEQGIPHIVLFDTTGDEDVEINKELGSMLSDDVLQGALPEVGQTMDVAVPYIDRDGTLYVQPIGPANLILQDVMKAINDYYTKQNTSSEDFVINPRKGQVVCAKYEGNWYRATITAVLPHRKVTVYYGDYGNNATLQTIHLRRLPTDIQHVTTLPMQALPCKLSGIDSWNDDVGMEAAHLTQSHDSFVLMTVKSATEGQQALVQLTNGNLHLNNLLLGVYEESQGGTPSTPSTADENNSQSIIEVLTISRSSQGLSSPGTPPGSPPDESIIEAVSPKNLNHLEEVGAGDYVTAKLEKLHLEQDTEEGNNQLKFVSPPGVGEWWDVFVTTTNEPSHFVVVPLSGMNQLNGLNDAIHKEFQNSQVVQFEPQSGELCAGLSTDDNFWYRVLVLDGKVGDKFKVIFTDYGNYDFMSLDRLRPLREEHKKLPLQAVRAGLYGIEPSYGNCWSEVAKQHFAALVDEQRLVSKIKSVDKTKNLLSAGPSVIFELYDTTKEGQSINIAAELVTGGRAKPQ